MIEQLIDLVRQHAVLYDHTCREYKNLADRNAAWEEIAEQLKEPADKCREDWVRLRNAFASVLNRRRKKKGDATITQWRFEDQMSFLRPFMEVRDGKKHKSDLFRVRVMQPTELNLKPKREEVKFQDMDDTDLFFMSMSKALKALPKIDQTKIKLDLHTAISEAEIRQIESKNNIVIRE